MENISVKPVWSKSKDEIWDEVFEPLCVQKDSGGFRLRISKWSYAAAIFIPILLICHFYTVTEETARSEHATVQLPGRSTVTLNAESKIAYKPFVWFISRKVQLEGEACFDVKPGSRFDVQSGDNRVTVLGTTFNVYARRDAYRVACLTGQVEVRAGQQATVLNPAMQATFRENKFSINGHVDPSAVTGWMQGRFVFSGTPLQEVIAEVERQYNLYITPDLHYDPEHLYTGNFTKTENPEEILEIIGKAFGITFSIE